MALTNSCSRLLPFRMITRPTRPWLCQTTPYLPIQSWSDRSISRIVKHLLDSMPILPISMPILPIHCMRAKSYCYAPPTSMLSPHIHAASPIAKTSSAWIVIGTCDLLSVSHVAPHANPHNTVCMTWPLLHSVDTMLHIAVEMTKHGAGPNPYTRHWHCMGWQRWSCLHFPHTYSAFFLHRH